MASEKPNFLSQPVVKNVFMFRNGDPYYEARRIVINERRVCNFETLLREVTGGVQAPFGAVRNIYTPRGGHKVERLESLQSGEQYVAAGKERFKKLDYLDIGTRKKRMMQSLPVQARPLPQSRIIVSARFLKPIKEPCTIFVVANGDLLNPIIRLLIHQRMMDQFERILEIITEKMGLRVLGGVRSLYTYEGQQVTDGNKLECGQLYVAVGRERFKKLPYSDLLFTRPKGARRIRGMKTHSLPPIYRFSKQSGNSKSTGRSSETGDGDSKGSPSNPFGNSEEHLASAVREISQARLLTLRKKKSGQSITADTPDNGVVETQADNESPGSKTPQDHRTAEKSDASDGQKASKGDSENTEEEPCIENTTETDRPTSNSDHEVIQETNVVKEEEKNETDEQNDEKGEEKAANELNVEKGEEKAANELSVEKGEEKAADEQNVEKGEEKAADQENVEKGEEKAANELNVEKGEEKAANELSVEKGEEKAADEQNVEKGEEKTADKENVEKGEEKVADQETVEKGEEKAGDEQRYQKDEVKAADDQNDDQRREVTTVEDGKEVKEEARDEDKNEVNIEEQTSTSSAVDDKTQDNKEQKEHHSTSSEGQNEEDNGIDEDQQEKTGGNREENSNDHSNDSGTGEAQKEGENSNTPGETQSDNAGKESRTSRSSSRNSNQKEDVIQPKDEAPIESGEEEKINGEMNRDNGKVDSHTELSTKKIQQAVKMLD